jgi:hypothetical protein
MKNKIKYSLLVCLLNILQVNAQYQLDAISSVWDIHKNKWVDSSEFKMQTQVNVFGESGFNSNAVTSEFLKAYYFNKSFIYDEIKSSVMNRARSSNRLGIVNQFGFCGQYVKGSLAFEAGYKNSFVNSIRFSKDVFELMFYGNKSFEGEYASLDPMKIYNYNSNTFFVGLKKQLKKNLIIGGRIGYVRGTDMQYVFTKNASLYTEPNGASLQLIGDYTIAYASDNSNTEYKKTSGNGVSLDLNVAWFKGRSSVSADIYDIGFIQWNNVSQYNASGTNVYNGFDIGNIFGSGGFKFNEVTLDSTLYAFGLEKEIKNKTIALPANVRLCYSYDFHSKYQLQVGMNYRILLSNIPQFYVRLAHYITPTWIIVPGVTYGGFGGANVNLGVSKLWKDKLIFSVHAMGLGYYAMPMKTSGIGVDAQLIYKL